MKPRDNQVADNMSTPAQPFAPLSTSLLGDTAVWRQEKVVWDAWCAQAPQPSFFCTTDWLETWWNTYGTAVEPWILRIHRGEATIGYAPLMRVIRRPLPGMNVRSIEFIGTGERVCPEYLDVIAAPGEHLTVRRAVRDFLADNRDEWDRLWLTDGLAGDSLADYIVQNHSDWPARHLIADHICPYIQLAGTWDLVLAGFGQHMRRKVRQIAHRIEREQSPVWRVYTPNDDPRQAVALMTDLHTRARQLKGEAGNFVDPVYQQLHTALIRRTAETGQIYLGFLELAGAPAAFFYGFLCGNTFFNYQTGYNPEFFRYRPGWYALGRMIQDLIGRGCERVDFLRGDHDYKWHWASGWQETVTGAVFSAGVAGRLNNWLHRTRQLVSDSLNSHGEPPDFVRERLNKFNKPAPEES
jgi:CelD/BcsL family acetyltransferase involved in cellulose biosynthesis